MLKAKEHYDLFLREEEEKGERAAFSKLAIRFSEEVKEIMGLRNARSDSALISVLKEQNHKWNALRKYDERFKLNGFLEFVKHRFPFVTDRLEEKG